jgi:hypothetical protein
MKRYPHGTIFAVPLPDGTYVCGRVTLDIYSTVKRRLLPLDSPLLGIFTDAYVIEMYSSICPKPEYVPSPILIPGAFVDPMRIGAAWPVLGANVVDPHTVAFPEYLIGFTHAAGNAEFRCGEIRVPLPFGENDVLKRIGVLGTRQSSFLWPFICLRVIGRNDDIPANYKTATLEDNDLRFSRHRAEVYAHLPFSMKQSYFEKQAQMGLHLERLYE